MNIAFDLDGVVFKQDLAMLRLIDMTPDEKTKEEVSKYYYKCLEMDLNPLNFITEGDQLFFITGRNEKFMPDTEKIIKKFFPNSTLLSCNHIIPLETTNLQTWFKQQAAKKAHYINQNKIDVYFEDTVEVVEELRKLCSNTKIICYGSRLKE